MSLNRIQAPSTFKIYKPPICFRKKYLYYSPMEIKKQKRKALIKKILLIGTSILSLLGLVYLGTSTYKNYFNPIPPKKEPEPAQTPPKAKPTPPKPEPEPAPTPPKPAPTPPKPEPTTPSPKDTSRDICPSKEPNFKYCPVNDEKGNILVFTSYTKDNPNRLKISRKVVENQRRFSKYRGYQYLVYEKNLAQEPLGDSCEEVLPYFSKIAGLRRILNNEESLCKKPEWIIWMDDDAVVTNKNNNFEQIINRYARDDTNVIITEDSHSSFNRDVPLNSAILIVRNNEWSKEFFDKVWEGRNERAFNGYTYGTCPKQSCLHEQQVISNLLRDSDDLSGHVKIIPQRHGNTNMNTFSRFNHHDIDRDLNLYYSSDPEHTKWAKNDFIGQCTGLATNGRRKDDEYAKNLRDICIDDLLYKSNIK